MGHGEMFLSIDPKLEFETSTLIEKLLPSTPHFVTRTLMLEQQIADRDKMITMLEKDVEFLRGLVKK